MPSQLDYTVSIGKETTYGTAVTPTRSFESDAKLDVDQATIQGSGMRPTKRVNRRRRNSVARRDVSGEVMIDAPTKGLGFLLNAVMGVVTNTAITGSPGSFQQVHTLRKDDPIDSYTIQEVIPLLGGAGQPHTFVGCVADTLDIEAKEGNYVTVKVGFLGKDVLTATGATAPTYPTGDDLFSFVHGVVGLAASGFTAPTAEALAVSPAARADVVDFSLSVKNNLDKGGFNLGGAGRRSRKNLLGKGEVTGKVTVEYNDNTLRDASLAQSDLVMVLTFTNGTAVLQIALPCILLKGKLPASNGGAPVSIALDFEAFDNDTATEAIWVVYRTTDTLP